MCGMLLGYVPTMSHSIYSKNTSLSICFFLYDKFTFCCWLFLSGSYCLCQRTKFASTPPHLLWCLPFYYRVLLHVRGNQGKILIAPFLYLLSKLWYGSHIYTPPLTSYGLLSLVLYHRYIWLFVVPYKIMCVFLGGIWYIQWQWIK